MLDGRTYEYDKPGTLGERVRYTKYVLERNGRTWYEIQVVNSGHAFRIGARMFTLREPQDTDIVPALAGVGA